MQTEPLVRDLTEGAVVPAHSLRGMAESALSRARDWLFGQQAADGHFCGELEGDTILESEYILTKVVLGRVGDPRSLKAAETLRQRQLENGGWAIYEGGPTEVSASVKAYFALKIVGDSTEAPHMARAREAILGLGGIEACNSYTKIYLAMFGQYEWSRCPAVPPELMLLPRWFYFNLYEMSAWSRAIVVPLCIMWAFRPKTEIPAHHAIPELYTQRARGPWNGVARLLGRRTFWTMFFTAVDRGLKICDKSPWKPLRKRALARAESWMLSRLQKSDGLGAIFPPILNTIFAMRCLGYAEDDPRLLGQIEELEKLVIEEDATMRVQPCKSPVWDTAMSLNALLDSGVAAEESRIGQGLDWLIDHEVREPGDWCIKVPGVEPSGWYFEYANEFYPDCDDTAEVLALLGRAEVKDESRLNRLQPTAKRALAWSLAMQNDDGGWAAFDRGCDKQLFTYVPFADHNAMLDPSCEDITGRMLEAFATLGLPATHPSVQRGRQFLLQKQGAEGAWYGRWGCNYIYGTWLAVSGLCAVGDGSEQPAIARAVQWLLSVQNEDGGFGESPASYDFPDQKGVGPSTAAQTAWALLTLIAAKSVATDAMERAVQWLLNHQKSDGSWYDVPWTGTGFPRVFYLRYHLYATYFPLMALGQFTRMKAAS